ncbi:MAG: ROK family protein [Actinomycetota bacterium]
MDITEAMGIDIGGSGIKGAPADVVQGRLTGPRLRVSTPDPSTPDNVVEAVVQLVADHNWSGPVGVTIPGVVLNGTVATAANIDDAWIGFDARERFSQALGLPTAILNDADAAGLAEARFGGDASGVVILLTFGTGIGSAVIQDGKLVPNTELGHLEFHGGKAETYAAARLVKRESMRIDWWAERVNEYLAYIETLFSPDRIIIGGGISKRFDEFSPYLSTRCAVQPARLRNNAGIVGAALYATEETR